MLNKKRNDSIQFERYSINDFFKQYIHKNNEIEISLYQREYCWEKENVLTLLEDLKSRVEDKKEHYFGMITTTESKAGLSAYKKRISN